MKKNTKHCTAQVQRQVCRRLLSLLESEVKKKVVVEDEAKTISEEGKSVVVALKSWW